MYLNFLLRSEFKIKQSFIYMLMLFTEIKVNASGELNLMRFLPEFFLKLDICCHNIGKLINIYE